MAQIISIINQKGGVGKSSTALALGQGLAVKGQRVLFVDLDAQGNLSYTLSADPNSPTSFEVLTKEAQATAARQKAPGGDLIAASPALAGADTAIAVVGKEYRLKEALGSLTAEYDYIIIDTPPALGILTINALTASHGAIVPAQADIYSLTGIGQLSQTIGAVRQYCNPELKIIGILLTRHNSRSVLSRDMAEMMEETAQSLKTRLFKTPIRETVAVKEAQAKRESLFSYAPKSNAAQDYMALIKELKRIIHG